MKPTVGATVEDMDLHLHLNLHQKQVPLARENWAFWTAIATIAAVCFFFLQLCAPETVKAPTYSFTRPFIPKIFSRLMFTSSAPTVIYGGYNKYKDIPYRLLRPDGDLIVLPNKYCEELRALPDTELNALEATFANHVGRYTTILIGSDLHTKAIQRRLTPSLDRLVPRLIDELRYAFEVDFPKCEDTWVPVKPYSVILRLVARAGSRAFVGKHLCREDDWLEASISFTTNIISTMAVLRAFPEFLVPIISKFLPSCWRLNRQLKLVKELIIPIVEERRKAESLGAPGYEKPDDFLQWMMDLAENEEEADPGNLAHRLLGIISMAVVHTSAMTIVHIIYDLISMPEYVGPLRAEIKEALPQGWGEATKITLRRMKHLDSFMKESQRLNPPGHLSFHRIVKEAMTLSDGFELPKGAHICMPSGPISMDSSIIPNADRFDCTRWLVEESGAGSFVSTSPTSLHFGIGKYACPGRFFASDVIKLILIRILLDYEFRFHDTQRGRPNNMVIGDKIVADLYTDVFFKRRAIDGTM